MEIEFIQIVIIVGIIIVFGVLITITNLKKKVKVPVSKEQNTWQKIEQLNNKKKEFLKKKEEVSFKYSAKSITDDNYAKTIKYINEELKKIDDAVNEEVSKLTDLQKNQDTGGDLRFQNIKLKGDLSELMLERDNLKNRTQELEEFIKNMTKSTNNNLQINESAKNKYYELILTTYKDIINNNEKKTISQIKDMVDPDNLSVKSIISKYKPIGYDFNKDYFETLRVIYNYLKSEIEVAKNDIRVLYWLDATQILKHKIADEQDAANMLCSIMKALKDNDAYIYVVLLEDDRTHAIVKTKFKGVHYILDLTQKTPFDLFKDQDENKLFENYNYKNKKITRMIYKYNNNTYVNFEEE